jgi:hypothetical protein
MRVDAHPLAGRRCGCGDPSGQGGKRDEGVSAFERAALPAGHDQGTAIRLQSIWIHVMNRLPRPLKKIQRR